MPQKRQYKPEGPQHSSYSDLDMGRHMRTTVAENITPVNTKNYKRGAAANTDVWQENLINIYIHICSSSHQK